MARSIARTIESDKIKDTVHIAKGDKSDTGGAETADLHQDLVIWEQDLTLDERSVVREGNWSV